MTQTYFLGFGVLAVVEGVLWFACNHIDFLGKEREDEPFPREWTVLLLPVAGGAAYWGWRLGRWGFIGNLLASVVLIGPGLLFTYIIAARWRSRRLSLNVAPKLSAVCEAVMPVVTGLIDVAPTLPQPIALAQPARTSHVNDLSILKDWLKSALESLLASLQSSPVEPRETDSGGLEYTFAPLETAPVEADH